MTSVARDVEGCRTAQVRLMQTVDGLTEAQARQPSLLPDWTVAHVLTHIARNGDSVVRRLDGAARGVVVDQYPGGFAGRAEEIEDGAGRPLAEIVADLVAVGAAVDAACEAMPADAWDNGTRMVDGEVVPAHRVVFSRWREIEVHHADLGLGYSPADWPAELVQAWLPSALESVPERSDPNLLLAWILGRGPAPELESWG